MTEKRNAGLFVGVSVLSGFGGGVLSLVAGVWVMSLTGSSSLAGMAALFVYLPTLFGPVLGLAVDRLPRRPLLIWTNLATAACVLTLLLVRSEDQTWLVYAVMLARGVAYVFLDAGESALLPAALSAPSVGHVNGWRTSAQEGMKLIAPLAGAALFAWWGGPIVAVVASGTLVLSAVLYGLIRIPRRPRTTTKDDAGVNRHGRGVWSGLRYLYRDRTLRWIVVTAAVSIAMSGITTAAVFEVISVDLHRPPEYIGVLASFQGAGSIAGGLVVGRMMARAGHPAVAVLGAVVFAIACALRLVPLWPVQLLSSLLTGIGLPWTLVAAMTAVQLRTPDELLGRVSATASAVLFGPVAVATPIGAALVLVDHRVALVIAATAGVIAAVPSLRSDVMPRIARSPHKSALVCRRRAGGDAGQPSCHAIFANPMPSIHLDITGFATMRQLSRRTLVLGGLATAGAISLPVAANSRASAASAAAAASPFPFTLGVASGEPAPDSVVLWTRLAPSPTNADGQGGMANADVVVDWQVSANERFTSLVASGSVTARYADAHSVHVVAGGLAPDGEYYYRFRAQGHISAVGRTRTAPAFDAVGRDLLMAFASCAHYESGYFTAYRRIAEDRPDLVLHLGDYIYEDAATTGSLRQHLGAEIVSLADYRRRHAQYKADPDLQAAHAMAPWLVVPDDHEVENNYANMVRADSSPALTAAQWTARRTAAYKAYYENMPLRPSAAPSGNSIPLYRRVRWGRLATFHMLDTRQFRDDQACGDGWKVCSDADLASRSLTGGAQETWLLDGLNQKLGTWDILGQQVFFARQFDAAGAASMDAWDGYRASRSRIQQGWVDRGVRNPVVLTGDVHRAWANDLKADYTNTASKTIGTELVCTSITSGGNGSASTTIPNVATNPHLRFSSERRGYVRTKISAAQITADFRTVASVTEHGAPATTARTFVIHDGQPGLADV